MTGPSDVELLSRLVLAVVLGALIGAEREWADHPAGLRTHVTVAVGSALFAIVSAYGFFEFDRLRSETVLQADVTRVASNIVTGVGFLGGGAIIKEGASVKGLTTAASLWVIAAVGLAVGLGSYASAIGATVIVLVGLVGLRLPERWIARRSPRKETVFITLRAGAEVGPVVGALAEATSVRSLQVGEREGQCVSEAAVRTRPGEETEVAIAPLADRDDVLSVDVS